MGNKNRGHRGSVERARRGLEEARANREWATRESARVLATSQQFLIDTEVAATRRGLLREVRRRGGRDATAFLDADFLAVADQSTLVHAVMDAAVTAGAADSCDLQLYDPATRTLRITGHRGFPAEFLAYFHSLGDDQAGCSCVRALADRKPVFVDDVTRSAVFAGQQSLEVIRAAGCRAVHSYPLLAATGEALGVISFHYRRPGPPHGGAGLVAVGVVKALSALHVR